MTYVQGGGAGGAPTTSAYITQTPDASLSGEQALSALATGLLKNTTGTGVLSIGVAGTDYAAAAHTHAAADISSGTIATARLGSGTANSTTFLRGDQTYATPTATLSATTVEVNLGSSMRFAGKFTITDAGISATSKVLCWQAPGPYTGKGTRADEAELQPVSVIAVEPATGSAVVRWQTPPYDSTAPQVAIESKLGGGTSANTGTNRDLQFVATRIGKVRGNVKFSYLVA